MKPSPPGRPRSPSPSLILAAGLAACGSKSENTKGEPEKLSLDLDFYPNPDHAGIYMAQEEGFFEEAGLEVAIDSPTDPSAPLKDVAAGRADLAITYEPEVMLAHEKGLDVVAVAALVNQPLTSLIWLKKSGIKGPAELKGKTVSYAGIPYQEAFLKTILRRAKVPASTVKTGQRRLRPDPLAGQRLGRRDARRLLERRGRRPARSGQRTGDHPGRPTRRADLRRARLRRPPLDPGRRGAEDPPLHQRPASAAPKRRWRNRKRRAKRSSPPTRASNRN